MTNYTYSEVCAVGQAPLSEEGFRNWEMACLNWGCPYEKMVMIEGKLFNGTGQDKHIITTFSCPGVLEPYIKRYDTLSTDDLGQRRFISPEVSCHCPAPKYPPVPAVLSLILSVSASVALVRSLYRKRNHPIITGFPGLFRSAFNFFVSSPVSSGISAVHSRFFASADDSQMLNNPSAVANQGLVNNPMRGDDSDSEEDSQAVPV